jgi:RimJ/RimL family protein N-acetyltransferase
MASGSVVTLVSSRIEPSRLFTTQIAVVVADAWQGQGVGTRMLSSLAALARSAGIDRFTVTMQADNRGSIRLLRRFDSQARLVHSQGIYEATISLNPEVEP